MAESGFLTGSLLGSQCYLNGTEATDAYFLTLPRHTQPGLNGTVVETYYSKGGSAWYRIQATWPADGVSAPSIAAYAIQNDGTAAGYPTLPACDPAGGFVDGVAIGWGIVLCMILAYAFVMMKRAAR